MADNKQYITHVKDEGRILISEDVLATIAVQALAVIEGFEGLSNEPGADIVDLIGKKNWGKGIKVTICENDDVLIECNVAITYGHSVVAVANAIQDAVANVIRSMAGVSAVNVNVNVCGIIRQ